MKGTTRWLHLALSLCLATPAALGAQSAATVPGSDAAYDYLAQLVDLGVTPRVTLLERPLSRREVARIAMAADRALKRDDALPGAARARAVADELLAAFAPEVAELRGVPAGSALRGAPLAAIRADAIATNSLARDVPRQNGVGMIDARIDPFVEERWGRTAPERGVQGIETVHRVGIGSWLALGARPRIDLVEHHGGAGGTDVVASLHTGYARVRLWNLALEAGLDERSWGPGDRGGLTISSSSLPLPALTLQSDTAFRLPWIFGRLGPTRMTAMLSDLGERQTFPHAKLAGYTISFAPADRVAFGVSLLDHMGGFGAPATSLGGRIADMFPYIDWLVRKEKNREATNKLAGGDLRIRIPEWRGTTVRWEFLLDDFEPKRIPRLLWDDTGELLGVDVARLTSDGALSASVEYRRTSIRLYEHGQFTNGVTYHRTLIGDPLGPNAAGLYGALRWRPAAGVTVALRPEYEQRNPSIYRVLSNTDFRFLVTSERAREVRRRLYLDLARERLLPGASVSARLGWEHVSNFDYLGGTRDQAIAQLVALYRF